MNRFFYAVVAMLAGLAGQAQAFHPCGCNGGGVHHHARGHAAGFSQFSGSSQSFGLVQPQAQSFGLVQPQAQSFSLVQPQAQSFSLVPSQVQSYSLVANNGTSGASAFGLNQASGTAGSGGTTNNNASAEGLLSPALLSALRIACNLAGSNTGTGNGGTDLSGLTKEIQGLRADLKKISEDNQASQKAIADELKKLNTKIMHPPMPGMPPPVPMKTTQANEPAEEPSDFRSLREQAEKLAADSRPVAAPTANARAGR